MTFSKVDRYFMRQAIALARRGRGFVKTNPLVGAVVVKNGKIVGRGFHERFGGNHAERNALNAAGKEAEGATLFVTLEPCNHLGKTPPCTEAIIRSGIKRVVIAIPDPNPSVPGGGIATLRNAGIEVATGIATREAAAINCSWLKWVKSKRPLVVLKLAVSADLKIAAEIDTRSAITAAIANAYVHRLRSKCAAIMVGARTVVVDNPLLTNRSGFGTNPLRIILDSQLRTSPNSKCYENSPALVFATELATEENRKKFLENKIEVIFTEAKGQRVNLIEVIDTLGSKGVTSVLCEGGSELATSLIINSLWDYLIVIRGEQIFLGEKAVTAPAFIQKLFAQPSGQTATAQLVAQRKLGCDTLYIWENNNRCLPE